MSNFDKPAMWRIVQTHFLLFKPRRRILRIDDDMLVVVRQASGRRSRRPLP